MLNITNLSCSEILKLKDLSPNTKEAADFLNNLETNAVPTCGETSRDRVIREYVQRHAPEPYDFKNLKPEHWRANVR